MTNTAQRTAVRERLVRETGTLAIGCASLFSSVFPTGAQAAEPPQTGQNLGSVTVTDTAIDEGSYKTERLSSPKATAPLVDTPRSITVLSRQMLDDTATTTLTDALRMVPGITLGAGEGGNPLGDRPFIRGADSQGSIYLDGVRDLAATSRETYDVESIEVTKGSDSVTNGSGNGGGSINVVTKTPTARRFAELDVSGGNAKYKRVTADVNQPLNDFIGVRIAGMYHYQGYAGRDATWVKRWGIAPSIKLGLTGPTSLTFDWYHLHSTGLPDEGIPYYTTAANQFAVTGSNFVETAPASTAVRARSAYYGLVDRDFQIQNTDAVTARFEHELDSGIKLRNTLRYNNTTQEYLWTQPDDSKGNVASYGTVGRRANSRYSGETGWVDQADVSGKFKTAGLEHSFAGALEYSQQDSFYGSYYANSSYTSLPGSVVCATATSGSNYNCTSLANPNPYDPYVGSVVTGPEKSRTLARSSTLSASLFDTISAGEHWKLDLGGRFDHYITNASAGVSAPFTAARVWQHVQNDLFTYQAGLLYKPVENGTIYVSTATSAVPPGSFLAQGSEDNSVTTLTGITADDLKVQKTTSYELGTKWNLFHDALALSADVFQTRTTNARSTAGDGQTVAYVGLKRVRGVELSVSGNVTPAWSLFGGYTFMDSKILDAGTTRTGETINGVVTTTYAYAPAAATGHQFPNTPRNSLSLFTNYKVTHKATLGGGAMYMSKVYGGFSDTRTADANGNVTVTGTRATYVPAYWRFDANASYAINRIATVKVSALNLTNKLYYDEAYATHYAHQAAGRTVIGTLAVKY